MENKKSIFSVICVILLVVNLILTCVVAFFTVPANKKMNELLTLVVKELKLDTEKDKGVADVPMNQRASIPVIDKIQINLTSEDGSSNHYINITAAISLNKKAKDYEKVTEQINNNQGVIVSDIRNTVAQYTYETIAPDNFAPVLEREVAEVLRERFNTETIVEVNFGEYIYN